MACWRNKAAMLVFGLGWTGLLLGVGLLLSLLAALLGGSGVINIVAYPLVLLLASMFHASVYFSFRDSFVEAGASEAP
jgi:hypothetical protein